MKVKDLIRELQKSDPEGTVYIDHPEVVLYFHPTGRVAPDDDQDTIIEIAGYPQTFQQSRERWQR